MFNNEQLKINAERSAKIQADIAAYQKKGGKIYKAKIGESAYVSLIFGYDTSMARLTQRK